MLLAQTATPRMVVSPWLQLPIATLFSLARRSDSLPSSSTASSGIKSPAWPLIWPLSAVSLKSARQFNVKFLMWR